MEKQASRPAPQESDFGHEFWQIAPVVSGHLENLPPGCPDADSFRLLADYIPTLCWIANGDGYIVWYNRRWHEYCGTTPAQMEGWGWQTVHDPELLPDVMERWTKSIATGEPFEMIFPLRGADGIFRPFLTRIQPVRDESGRVVRWFGVNTEISAQVEAERALRSGEERLKLVQAVGGIGSFDYDLQKDFAVCSKQYYELMGLPPGTPITLSLAKKMTHPDDVERVFALLDDAIANRAPIELEYRIIRASDGEERWITSNATLLLDAQGQPWRYVGGLRDITDRKIAAEQLRTSEERFRLVLNSSPGGLYAVDREGNTTLVSHGFLEMMGFASEEEVLGKKLHPIIHHTRPDGSTYSVEECPIYRCAATGEGSHVRDEYFYRKDGSAVPVEYWVAPIHSDGIQVGASCTIVDLSERKKAEAALVAESRRLETLNRTGSAVAAELDLERLVQLVTDAGVELVGAKFGAFFYNVIDPEGERLLLYTLSGADRSDFEKFGMPRATKVFRPTFEGEGTVRADDITKDPRYGKNKPYKGMPEGHLPVRSYLAVPVVGRENEVMGGLFFGHPEPGIFTHRHEELMTGIAAQAAVAIDNARLYRSLNTELTERMKAENALRDLNETLEQRVNDEIRRRSEVEEALRQAQKMETLGQLTGGIAHDFNNLLQVIAGNVDIMRRQLPDDANRLIRAADNALAGATRAATLTQRLLAFSRRQPLSPKPSDINRLVATMSELLHRTLGETIEIETVLAPRVWPIEVDPNQLENAIINLAVNARDAMPDGGKLTIETQNTHLDRPYTAQHPEISPGQYVVICISDTGTGMDQETLGKAIEPFFTTKEVGRGTGLGLSMVYGFVKQSGGHFRIYSEVGEGTTVKIYLPRLIGAVPEDTDNYGSTASHGTGDETILVCEDDDEVRAYSVQVLRELGYRVLEAHDGPSALRLVQQKGESIDLLFTDVVLPGGMSGADVDREARKLRPALKTLFTTGYARNAIFHHGRLDPGIELITKPFSYSDLAERIRSILDAPAVAQK